MISPLAVLVFRRHEYHAELGLLPINLVQERREIFAPEMLWIEIVVEHSNTRRSKYLRKFLSLLPLRTGERYGNIKVRWQRGVESHCRLRLWSRIRWKPDLLDNILPQPLGGSGDRQERQADTFGGCIGLQERFDGRRKARRMCIERPMCELDIPFEWAVCFNKLECAVVASLKIEFRALVKFFQP